MAKRYYIAYGSNLNIPQMRMRCPTARIIGTSELPDHRLLFRGSQTGAYLTVEPYEGESVPVAVWEVSARDETALDRYEGFPRFYYKAELTLPITGIRSDNNAGSVAYDLTGRRVTKTQKGLYIVNGRKVVR